VQLDLIRRRSDLSVMEVNKTHAGNAYQSLSIAEVLLDGLPSDRISRCKSGGAGSFTGGIWDLSDHGFPLIFRVRENEVNIVVTLIQHANE